VFVVDSVLPLRITGLWPRRFPWLESWGYFSFYTAIDQVQVWRNLAQVLATRVNPLHE